MQGIETLGYEVVELPMVPQGGIQGYEQAADILAEFGRNGDTYIVHAAEGETMVPMEVLDNNPRLKKMLFAQMQDMGIEPERYIVGNELNSINPVTGRPEFFLKKLFKGVKKAVKNVANVAKKVAPLILPIAAPFLLPAMPIAFATGIGSLAGGLIAGQDFATAAKNAVIAGGLAGLGNVAFGGAEGFGSGKFFGSVANPTGGLGTFSMKQAFTPVIPFSAAGKAHLASLQAQGQPKPSVTEGVQTKALGQDVTFPESQNLSEKLVNPELTTAQADSRLIEAGANVPPAPPPSPVDQAIDFYQRNISPSGRVNPLNLDQGKIISDAQKLAADQIAQQKALGVTFSSPAEMEAALNTIRQDALKQATLANTPGTFSQYAPAVALGTAGAVAADAATGGAVLGLFKDEDGDGNDDETGMSLEEYKQAYPGQFFDPAKFYGDNPFYAGFATVAQGGEIVGPGTPTSDSIPALLSDGEFVMNAAAVRGAGNGDRKEGAKKMYAMMRKFEGRA